MSIERSAERGSLTLVCIPLVYCRCKRCLSEGVPAANRAVNYCVRRWWTAGWELWLGDQALWRAVALWGWVIPGNGRRRVQ